MHSLVLNCARPWRINVCKCRRNLDNWGSSFVWGVNYFHRWSRTICRLSFHLIIASRYPFLSNRQIPFFCRPLTIIPLADLILKVQQWTSKRAIFWAQSESLQGLLQSRRSGQLRRFLILSRILLSKGEDKFTFLRSARVSFSCKSLKQETPFCLQSSA